MRKQTHILIVILVFTMFMAISASMTRVWIDGITPKEGPKYRLLEHKPLKSSKPSEANRNLIRLHAPIPGAVITSPLFLAGEARGYWFFEADAPVQLFDAKTNEIAAGYVAVKGEWMTEDFVAFSGELEFEKPETSTGTLVLRNANASGDPERDIYLKIPVRFE